MTLRGSLVAAALAVGGWLGVGATADAQFYFQGTFGNRVGVNVQVGSPFGGGYYPGVAYPGFYHGGFNPVLPPPLPGPPPPPPLFGPNLPAVPAYGGSTYLYQSQYQYPAYNAWGANYGTHRLGYYR